jgi:hypothetical protein
VRDLTPAMRDVSRAATNTGQVSESVLLEMQRLDAVMQDAAESWTQATGRLHEAIVPTLGRVAMVAAAWRVARRGHAIYRWLRR